MIAASLAWPPAGGFRYDPDVFWQKAPDQRTSITLDWLNDACERKLGEDDRINGKVKYHALMSPSSVTVPFDWKHPFTRRNRADILLGRHRQIPVSLLLTTKQENPPSGPYMLLGIKKRVGRLAWVKKYTHDDVSCHGDTQPAKDGPNEVIFPRRPDDTMVREIRVTFATDQEAEFLRKWLRP